MKRPGPLFKVAAVFSSVLLFAGLVAYRAGAFDRLLVSETPGNDSEPIPAAAAPESVDTVVDPVYLSTSKSATFVVPPSKVGGPPAKQSPALMSGSKSIAPVFLPPAQKDGPATSPKPTDGPMP